MATSASPLETRFSPLSQIVRRRLLPSPGDVLVQVGDRVQADDVVARAMVPGRLLAIDLAQALGVSARSVPRHVLVDEGQTVAVGDALARSRRFRMRVGLVVAPCAGTVQGIADGRIFLRQEPQLLELRAYLSGKVTAEYPHRGVAIRTRGSLVRGIWGCGDESQGLLATLVREPGDALAWEKVGPRYRGAILVGGILENARVLTRAVQFRIRGLVLGSMLPSLRPLCESLSLSVVITEGMGRIPMAGPIYDCLRSHHGSPAVMSGCDRHGYGAPEVIVPAATDEEATPLAAPRPIETGAQVRITRPPHLGLVGEVIALPGTPQPIRAGTRAMGARVRLRDGRVVFVPHANLELLG